VLGEPEPRAAGGQDRVVRPLREPARPLADPDSTAGEQLAELRASVRTKIVLLASAYDCEYGDSYCRRIAKDPQSFGDYELSRA